MSDLDVWEVEVSVDAFASGEVCLNACVGGEQRPGYICVGGPEPSQMTLSMHRLPRPLSIGEYGLWWEYDLLPHELHPDLLPVYPSLI